MPEGVRVNDEVFGLSTATIYYQLTRPSTETKGPYVKDWVSPKDQYAQRQTRFDYARRILTVIGKRAEITEIKDALRLVWNWIQDHHRASPERRSAAMSLSELVEDFRRAETASYEDEYLPELHPSRL